MTDSVDDASIPDSEHLYRRIHPSQLAWDDNSSSFRVSSADWYDATGDVSVYLDSVLKEKGIPPTEVLHGYPQHSLVFATAGDARLLGFNVVRDPDDMDDHPRAVAHALLMGLKDGNAGKKTQRGPLAKKSVFVLLRTPSNVV